MFDHIHLPRRKVLVGAGMALLGGAARRGAGQTQSAVKPIIAPATAKAIADRANSLIKVLRPELRAKLQFAFNDPERKDWHNFPNMLHPRKGVRLGEMTDEERRAAHALMQTMLSGQGYLKVAGIMQHDEIFNDSAIAAQGGGRGAGGAGDPEVRAVAAVLRRPEHRTSRSSSLLRS